MAVAVFQTIRNLRNWTTPLFGPEGHSIPALDVPEIVQGIILQLSPHKQRTIARLVCKQWYRIACSVSPETLTWRVPLDREQCRLNDAKLEYIQILTFLCEPDPKQDNNNNDNDINPPSEPQLLGSTTEIDNRLGWTAIKDMIKVAQAEGRLSRVRELRVEGLTPDMLPVFPHLSVLRLYKTGSTTVSLKYIWESCPSLMELYVVRSRHDTSRQIAVTVLQKSPSNPSPPPPPEDDAPTSTDDNDSSSVATSTTTNATPPPPPPSPPLPPPATAPTPAPADPMRLRSNILEDPKSEDMAFLDLNLKTLVIYDLVLTLEVFKSLLKACPHLQNLKIIRAHTKRIIDALADQENLESERADAQALRLACYQLLAKSHPNIQEFQLSIFRAPPIEVDVEALSTLGGENVGSATVHLRERRRWSFLEQDISLSLLRGLRTLIYTDRNRLTELEFWPSLRGFSSAGEFLHEILCSCPNLLHVRAPQVTYDTHLMDVNDVMNYHGCLRKDPKPRDEEDQQYRASIGLTLGTQDPDINPEYITARDNLKSRIWVCRNLKTLQIWCKGNPAENSTRDAALIIFGYLSRVCPRLQELHLRRGNLSLQLTSGLCLLGRLQELERLKITVGCTGLEVTAAGMEWMRKKPQTMTPYKLLWAATKEFGLDPIKFVGPDSLCGTNVLDEKGRNKVQWLKEMPSPPSAVSDDDEEGGGHDINVEKVLPYPDLTLLGRPEDQLEYIQDTESLRFPMLDSFEIECWGTFIPNGMDFKDGKAIFETTGRKIRPDVRFEINERKNCLSLLED